MGAEVGLIETEPLNEADAVSVALLLLLAEAELDGVHDGDPDAVADPEACTATHAASAARTQILTAVAIANGELAVTSRFDHRLRNDSTSV